MHGATIKIKKTIKIKIMQEISWPAEDTLASQEGLCTMGIVV
jgi:hypothetical protein